MLLYRGGTELVEFAMIDRIEKKKKKQNDAAAVVMHELWY